MCPAEELPFEDASVDLLASFTAAHWFDIEKFMREVSRVVRPGGCVAISTYTVDMSLHYGTCSEKLTQIFREVRDETHTSGLPLLAWARKRCREEEHWAAGCSQRTPTQQGMDGAEPCLWLE